VELLGKVQRQEPDQLLYACLAYVRALGVPLYNFRVQPGAPEVAAGPAGRAWPTTPTGRPSLAAQPTPAAAASSAATPSAAAGRLPHQAQLGDAQQQQQQLPPQPQEQPCEWRSEVAPSQTPAAVQAQPPDLAPLQLKYLSQDPLLQMGGLVRVSEAGRVWRLRQQRALAHAHAQLRAHTQAQALAPGPVPVPAQVLAAQELVQAQALAAQGLGQAHVLAALGLGQGEESDPEQWSGSEIARWVGQLADRYCQRRCFAPRLAEQQQCCSGVFGGHGASLFRQALLVWRRAHL
jgi:hypothetical protein